MTTFTRQTFADFRECIREVLASTMQVRPIQKMWEWIDSNVVIPQVIGSLNPGPLDTSLLPFWRGVYDLYWRKQTHYLTICTSARIGKTLFSICAVMHKIDVWPGPILWMDPTRKTAMTFSRAELQHHFMECAPVAEKAIISKNHWTTLVMHFTGLVFRIVGGGSAADLAGFQAELVIINESDKIKHTIKGEAGAQDLAVARTKQFRHTRKIVENSTPTTEWGRVWTRFKSGSQNFVYLPCPHCKTMQRLTFFPEEKEVPFAADGSPLPAGEKRTEKTGRFKFEGCKNAQGVYDVERVELETVYECGECFESFDQSRLAWMLRRYELRSHNANAAADHHSVHCWAGYSPFEGWGQIAKEFLQARGNVSRMHNFFNSTLGLPFIRKATDIKLDDIDAVIARSPEYFLRSIPRKPEMLTMTVDVQGDCFWWSIRAWGIAFDMPELPVWSALIDYGSAVSWDQIEELAGIKSNAKGESNEYHWKDDKGELQKFIVHAGLIDSGFEAQSNKKVYNFTLKNADVFSPSKGGGYAQLRGQDVRTAPVNEDQQDLVWYYDDGFKQQLYYGCIKEHKTLWWLPRNTGADYREMSCNERTEEKMMPDGSTKLVWVCIGPNHLADTEKMHEVLRGTVESALADARDKWMEENAG
jgi:hypothetical protein